MFCLEFLNSLCGEVGNVASESLKRHSKPASSESCGKDSILEDSVAAKESLQLMGF